jgi:hypothetical protein
MQDLIRPSELAELTREKSKPLLSNSLDRAELLAAGVCVACRRDYAVNSSVFCQACFARIRQADLRAFAGYGWERRRI